MTTMNAAIRCIILLACMTICTSRKPILACRCLKKPKPNNAVLPILIADVDVLQPNPYCSRKEVIVLLKDGSSRCLDPDGDFTRFILQEKQKQRALHAKKMRMRANTTTISAPALAKAAPTSS